MTWQVDLLESDFTVVAAGLSGLLQAGFFVQRARDGLGAGTIAVTNDHASIDEFTPGRVLRWTVNGVERVTVLETPSYMRLGEEHSDEVTLLDGPGGLALLGEPGYGKTKGAVVVGFRSSGLRPFGWVAPDWDDSTWTPSVGSGTYVNPDYPNTQPRTLPPDFPCDRAQYIAHRAPDPHPNGVAHDEFEDAWFRQTFDFSGYDTIRVYWHADNVYRLWWSGEFVKFGRGTRQFTVFDIEDPGTEETLAAKVRNSIDHPTLGNPMHAMFAVYSVLSDGSDDKLIAYSRDGQGVWTDTKPDGVTAGYVMSRLVDDAQARGALPGISYTFTDTADSADTPVAWSKSLELTTYRDGEHYWPVLEQVLQQFNVDARMDADGELVILDSEGSDVGVDLTDGTVALTASVERVPEGANALRVQTPESTVWRTNAARIAAEGRREDSVAYGTVATVAEAESAVETAIDDARGMFRQTVETAGPAGAVPLVDYDVADTVGVRVADGGAYFGHTVEAIDVTVNVGNGEVVFDVDVERRL